MTISLDRLEDEIQIRIIHLDFLLSLVSPCANTDKPIGSSSSSSFFPEIQASSFLSLRNSDSNDKLGIFNAHLSSISLGKLEWAASEDLAVKGAVLMSSIVDWKSVASMVGNGRSEISCRIRYSNVSSSTESAGMFQAKVRSRKLLASEFTQQESVNIGGILAYRPPVNWCLIGTEAGISAPPDRIARKYRSLGIVSHHRRWSTIEDLTLQRAVQLYGVGKWSSISKHVRSRNDSQCRERWDDNTLESGSRVV